MDSRSFRILLISSFEPRLLARLIARIHEELPQVAVRGLLYEPGQTKTLWQRIVNLVQNSTNPGYLPYVGARLLNMLGLVLVWFGRIALWFVHAYAPRTRRESAFGLRELDEFCKAHGCALYVTRNLHAPETLAFARSLEPDLGIVYGTRILKPALFEIPRLGSINIHKRQLPQYRGGGPIGLWEMLDGKTEIGVTVHRVTARLDAGAIIRATMIPIEPYDTLRSLSLKADVVGNDLLVAAVADFVNGTVDERLQVGPSRNFRTPSPQDTRRYEKAIAARRTAYKAARGRPTWKLLLHAVAFAPYLALRNWYRRLRGSFPVVILYHHLVSDRPHPLGIPTDLLYRHVEYLRRYYRVVDLGEGLDLVRSGKVTAPTVVLTLDDGYKENYLNLRAVTEATGVPVTLFVCTEKITTQQEFEHDIQWGLRGFLPLTWQEVKRLERCGARIGSHTRSHFDCGSTDLDQLESELAGSKVDLECQLGHPVSHFSFPRGQPANMSPHAVKLAKKTYPYVCSAFGGANYPGSSEECWHVRRCYHPNSLWELELMLQSVLDL